MEPDSFYTVSEAPEILGVPYRKMLKVINNGDIAHQRYGESRAFRIQGRDLTEYIRSA